MTKRKKELYAKNVNGIYREQYDNHFLVRNFIHRNKGLFAVWIPEKNAFEIHSCIIGSRHKKDSFEFTVVDIRKHKREMEIFDGSKNTWARDVSTRSKILGHNNKVAQNQYDNKKDQLIEFNLNRLMELGGV